VTLLADDHARARRLAEGWHAAGLPVDLDQVETNFVQLDVEPLGMSKWNVIAALKEAGVGVSNTVHPSKLRAVTHLDVSDEDIEAAIALAPEALAARV
jgi:threonine aldolase